ncbi:NtaA/DmoA family FMN-dependent monooxygenase [Azotobacter vinelandii]
MSKAPGSLKLGLLLNSPGGSRAGVVTAGPARPSLLSEYQEAVRQLEKARFDFAMVADTVFSDVDNLTPPRPEPVTLFAALAAVTSHIGLLSTVSTGFTEPFNLARQILSLDHLSNGRAAWNVVTSSAGERNFGTTPLPAHSERYRRGLEYVEVVRKLWDSWEEDALYLDTDRRLAVDAGKVHRIDHRGEFFSVEGPLNLSRSPQGQPVLFQAGSSEDGKAFAAHFAEGVYTAQHTLKEARQFYDDLKEKTRRAGRNPDHIKILPGLSTLIGDTEEAARRLDEQQFEASGRSAVQALESNLGGIDVSDLDLDQRIPAERLPALLSVEGRQSRYGIFRQRALEEGWTLRQLLKLQAASAGHGRIVGTPEQVADRIQEWFLNGAADGFIVMPGQGPEGSTLFAEQVVPILQRRGLFRTDYEAGTLRGNLGLPIPRSHYGGWRKVAGE